VAWNWKAAGFLELVFSIGAMLSLFFLSAPINFRLEAKSLMSAFSFIARGVMPLPLSSGGKIWIPLLKQLHLLHNLFWEFGLFLPLVAPFLAKDFHDGCKFPRLEFFLATWPNRNIFFSSDISKNALSKF